MEGVGQVTATTSELPNSWGEVDELELQRIAVRLATGSVEPGSSDPGSTVLHRPSTTSLQTEHSDPLGFGRLNPRTLRLLRTDTTFSSRDLPSGQQGGFKAQEILLTMDGFDPYKFLAHVHVDSSLSELERGVENLRNELQEQTGELKQLVKENFDRFISCKSTIDDVHQKLVEGEHTDQSKGGTSGVLAQYVKQVRAQASEAFDPIIQRHTYSQRVRTVVNLLSRFHELFEIPCTVQKFAGAGDLEGVVSAYADGKRVLQESDDSVWESLLQELESVIDQQAEKWMKELQDPNLKNKQAQYLVMNLIALKNLGVKALNDVSPLVLILDAQEHEISVSIQSSVLKFGNFVKEQETPSQLSRQTSGFGSGHFVLNSGKLLELIYGKQEITINQHAAVELVRDITSDLKIWVPKICAVCRAAQESESGDKLVFKILLQCQDHFQDALNNILNSDDDALFFGGSKAIIEVLLTFLEFVLQQKEEFPQNFEEDIKSFLETIMSFCVENYVHRLPSISEIFNELELPTMQQQICQKQFSSESLEALESSLGQILDNVLIMQHNYHQIGLDWTVLQPTVSQGLQDFLNELIVESRMILMNNQSNTTQLFICEHIEKIQLNIFPQLQRQFESCFFESDYKLIQSQLSDLRQSIAAGFLASQTQQIDNCVQENLSNLNTFDFSSTEFSSIKMRPGVIILIELFFQIQSLVLQFYPSSVSPILEQIVKNLIEILTNIFSGIKGMISKGWLQIKYDICIFDKVLKSMFQFCEVDVNLGIVHDMLNLQIYQSKALGDQLGTDAAKNYFSILFDTQMSEEINRLNKYFM